MAQGPRMPLTLVCAAGTVMVVPVPALLIFSVAPVLWAMKLGAGERLLAAGDAESRGADVGQNGKDCLSLDAGGVRELQRATVHHQRVDQVVGGAAEHGIATDVGVVGGSGCRRRRRLGPL